MTKAVGYVRVSTQEQADHGYSIDAQIDKVKAYASLYDIELVDVVIDAGVSAKSLKRDGLTNVGQWCYGRGYYFQVRQTHSRCIRLELPD